METPAVHVWWVRLSQVAESLAADTVRLLTPLERTRASAYRESEDRDRFQLGVAITRLTLAGELGCTPADIELDRTCPDCPQPHGKVRLVGPRPGWELSVSHSGDFIGVAVSTVAPLGLDVEQVRAVEVESMASLVLSPDEHHQLRQTGAATTDFLRCWTRKEAVVKSTGDGLRQPLNLVTVTAPGERAGMIDWVGREQTAAGMSLYDLADRNGHLAALAVLTKAEIRIVEHDAEPLLLGWAHG